MSLIEQNSNFQFIWLSLNFLFQTTLYIFILELEINIKFPTCWDGVNIESVDQSHVAFALECDGDEFNECFDFDCPDSHPIRMPEIHLYVRVLGYEGGAHVFSNDTDVSSFLKSNNVH